MVESQDVTGEFGTCALRLKAGGGGEILGDTLSTEPSWVPFQQGFTQELTELTQEIHKTTCAQQELPDEKNSFTEML